MRGYVITRNSECTEWGMTEAVGEPKDIYRATDGTCMRAVLFFEAPSWEDAKRVLDWAFENLRGALKRPKGHSLKDSQDWSEVRLMLEPASQITKN